MLLIPYAVFASINSSTVEVTTLANTPADVVLEQTNDTSIDISWGANGNPTYTKYTVEYSQDNSNWSVAHDKVEQTNATVSGLQANTAYYVRVSSYNLENENNGAYAYLNGGRVVQTKPSAPSESQAPKLISQEGTEVFIEWGNEVGTDTKLYMNNELIVTYDRDQSPRTSEQRINDLIVLTPDTKYEFFIIYTNDAGDSSPSETLTIWTDANPATNLRVEDRNLDSIKVAVDRNGNPEGKTQYEYVLIDAAGSILSEKTVIKTETEHTFTDLAPGRYTIKVSTYNSSVNPNVPTPKKVGELELVTGTIPPSPQVSTIPAETSIQVTMTPVYTEGVEFRLILEDDLGNQLAATEWAKAGEGWTSQGFIHTFEQLKPNTAYRIVGKAQYAD